jgi:RNA polymerase-binding transcription factor DksA
MWRTQRVRRALLKRRDELLARDVARAGETDEWSVHALTALTERDLRELAGIIAGIRRIDEGTYGKCQHCDRHIERARLAESPAAIACGGCASAIARPPLRAVG